MKRLIPLLMIVLMLIGCAPQSAVPDVPSVDIEEGLEPVVEDEEPVVESPEDEEPEAEEPVEESASDYNFEAMPPDHQRKVKLVRKLLAEARDREENYFFRYSSPDILQTDVWVKGDVLKRAILRYNELDKYKTHNMVYLNMKTLKAEGYCETTKSKCWEGKGPFKETFSKWDIKTPKDWILELGDDFYWALDNKISDQLYHIVDYRQDGKTIRVYVNDYRGWPGKVEIYEGTGAIDSVPGSDLETYLYDDMDIGGVSDDDVTPG